MSAGTKQALFNACFALFAAGDEVLVPTPGWTSYYEMLTIARATAVPVTGPRENALKISARELARAAHREDARSHPQLAEQSDGRRVLSRRARGDRRVRRRTGWWILSDEIYRGICYDGEATSLLSVAPSSERLVVVDGVAKSLAMTGWRIGWSIAPRGAGALDGRAPVAHDVERGDDLAARGAVGAGGHERVRNPPSARWCASSGDVATAR